MNLQMMLLIRSLQLTMRRERDVRLEEELRRPEELPAREDQESGRSRSKERCFKLDDCHTGKGNGIKSQQERI